MAILVLDIWLTELQNLLFKSSGKNLTTKLILNTQPPALRSGKLKTDLAYNVHKFKRNRSDFFQTYCLPSLH